MPKAAALLDVPSASTPGLEIGARQGRFALASDKISWSALGRDVCLRGGGISRPQKKKPVMISTSPRPPSKVLQVLRTLDDQTQPHQVIWLLGVEASKPAIHAYRLRATLHRIVELLSAAPWHKVLWIKARNVAENPKAGEAKLHSCLEEIMLLSGGGRAQDIHDLARDELSATYTIVG